MANVVRVFPQLVKKIIHGNTFDFVFGEGEKSMWNSSEVVGCGFFIQLKLKLRAKKTQKYF